MRFQLFALLGLSSLAIASPVAQTDDAGSASLVCTKICSSEELTCPPGWFSNLQGSCYSCCKLPEPVDLPEPIEFCLDLCAFQEPTCPENMYPKKANDECWTCCGPA